MNSAFVPSTALPFTKAIPVRSSICMSAHKPAVKAAKVVAASLPAFLTASQTLAAEGTGAALGVESSDTLIFLPLIGIPLALFVLFAQFGGSQDNEEFFGEIDDRRK